MHVATGVNIMIGVTINVGNGIVNAMLANAIHASNLSKMVEENEK